MKWANRDTELVAEGIRQQGTDSNLAVALLSSQPDGAREARVAAISKSLRYLFLRDKRYWIGGETLAFAQAGLADFPELSHIDDSTVNWKQIAEWLLTGSDDRDGQ